jgi:three-Cys-motif partner protein
LHPIYIDGFAGAGTHIRKRTGELAKGSPLNALEIRPAFEELHLIDTDQSKVDALKQQTTGMKHVHVYSGDANQILQNKVLPNIKYEDYRRALCILDPYGLHLHWSVIARRGEKRNHRNFLELPNAGYEPQRASLDAGKCFRRGH